MTPHTSHLLDPIIARSVPPPWSAKSPRNIWLALALVGGLAIAVAGWRLIVDVMPLALSGESRLAEIRDISVTGIDVRDSEALSHIQVKVAGIQSQAQPAARTMRWLARFSPAVAWLPALDHEFAAWSAQASRLRGGLDSASALLAASSRLMDAYGEIQAVLTSPTSRQPPSLVATEARELEASFAATIEQAGKAARAGRGHRPTVTTPRLRDGVALLKDVEAQMATALMIGRQASGLLAELVEVGERAQPLVAQFIVEDGRGPEPLTVEELGSTLAELESRLQFTLVKSDGLSKLVADSRQSKQLLNRLDFLSDVLGVLLSLSRAAALGLQAVGPAIQAGGDGTAGLLAGEGGLVRALNGLVEHEGSIVEAVALLEAARETLAELESSSDEAQLARGIEDLVAGVDQLHRGLRLAQDIGPIGAKLVGAGSTQRYLVLGQSVDELRATGGFVSSVWLVTFEDGGLENVRYYDSVQVDDWDRLSHCPSAPAGLEEHMNAHVWLLRDVSWEPDFPTTARIAEDMFRIGQRQEVDGVAAINQWTLLSLLEALGSVPSPGGDEPITPHNLFSNLEEGSDQYGRAYMDLVLQGLLGRLNEPLSLSTLVKIASALDESLQGGDLLLFLDKPGVQAVAAASGWDGRIRHNSMDYLYVVDSNVGWSKSDRNIERTVSYEVDLTRDSGVRISLGLGYINHSGPGSPGCEPQWLNRGTDYSQLKNACYWDYWRVYTPQEARLLSATPLALPEYSVSVAIGKGQPGDDTVRVASNFNRKVYSGLFAIEAGAARDINLPSDLVDRRGNVIDYQLLIQKQPGIRRREVSVEFILPAGFHLDSSSAEPDFEGDSRVGFRLQIKRDMVLSAQFTRRNDGAN